MVLLCLEGWGIKTMLEDKVRDLATGLWSVHSCSWEAVQVQQSHFSSVLQGVLLHSFWRARWSERGGILWPGQAARTGHKGCNIVDWPSVARCHSPIVGPCGL